MEGAAIYGVRIALVQLGLAAAAGNLVTMAALLTGAQDRAAALVTLLLLLAIFPWSLGVALQSVPEILASFEALLQAATLALFWIPPTALHVACRWTHRQDCRVSRWLLVLAYGLGALGFGAQSTGLLPLGGPTDHGWGVMRGGRSAWLLFTLHGLLTLSCLGVAAFWCWSSLGSRAAPAGQKLGARVWLLSAVVFSAAAVSNYLVVFGLPVVPAGSLGNVLFLCVLAFFVTRHGFLHVRSEVRRVAAAVTLGVLGVWVGASLWITLISPPLLSARWVSLELAAASVGGAVVVGYGLLLERRRTAGWQGVTAGGARELGSAEGRNLKQRLQTASTPQELSALVLELTHAWPPVRSAAIYRRPLGAKLFRLDASRGSYVFPTYATRAQLLSGLTAAANAEGASLVWLEPPPPERALSLQGAADGTMLPLHSGAEAEPLRPVFLSCPVVRLGECEGYVVVEVAADAALRLEEPLPLAATALTLAALWHNLELRSGGLTPPIPSSGAEEKQGSGCEQPPVSFSVSLPAQALGQGASWGEDPALQGIVGQSRALRQSLDLLRRAATLDLPVLLLGETGTGKELFARALHAWSARKHRPFQAINCAAIPLDLAENELFGHERGAYTGALQAHVGWLERLSGGVVFLDEVAELPLALQAKLLRVMEYGELTPLGSTETRHVDLRVVAATNRSLEELVRQQRFREDLYHRLRGIVIVLPPLRERLEDIPLLVEHFRKQASASPTPPWPEEALRLLMSYSWPGNVRELRSLVFSLVGLCGEGQVTVEMVDSALRARAAATLPPAFPSFAPGYSFRLNLKQSLSQAVRAYKIAHVQAALSACHGNASSAARMLGLTKSNFNRLLRSLGLDSQRR
ncbi:Nitrogen assimilation regulatory protein [bacterium HR30]|nr:Nitrogen assimilation regulatory protein [bacterium HR30]